MLKLNDNLNNLQGVGPYYEARLKNLGLISIKDLLFYFPFRYQDFTNIKNIQELEPNEQATTIATITKIRSYRTFKKHMLLTNATAEDETGKVDIVWFNQPYIQKTLKEGTTVSLSGKLKPEGKKLIFQSPAFELVSQDEDLNIDDLKHTGRLVPIYPETMGISSKLIRSFTKRILKIFVSQIPEPLPEETRKNHNLMDIQNALSQIHFPDNQELALEAKKRFIFEEMLLVQIHLLNLKQKLSKFKAPKIKKDVEAMKEFVNNLPFTLTDAQRKAIWEMMQDIETGSPMNRLMEGDVGSGKTVVALAIAYLLIKNQYQVAFMAPTEVLAKQHFQTLIKILKPFDMKVACITGEGVIIKDGFLEGKVTKEYILESLKNKTPWLIVGTHALIQKSVSFGNLGLVIIDEQHRFGVEQRKKLLDGKENKLVPHLLSMTATPIPRTLALAMYGDLELSILDEMPKGRQTIITKIISKRGEEKMFEFIKEQIKEGRQAFVVCPRIEEQTEADKKNILSFDQLLNYEVKAVKKEYEKIKKHFDPIEVGMLHGKMKPKEKDEIMKRFNSGKTKILVSTSVIEVGIDVPNASIMVIEGAERFGLSQLHQFRGRVGRGEHQSYCFLFTESNGLQTKQRLKAMLEYSDGFKLAEIDLNLRGPGEFFGTNQSGFPDLAMQALSDTKTLAKIHEEAKNLALKDPNLKAHPLLLARYNEFLSKFHME